MKFNQKHIYFVFISIVIISISMHYNHFSKDLIGIHVWRQTQTQTTINNFYDVDMNIFNPQQNELSNDNGIFRMEFPLMQWLVACTYKVFGKNIIISRLFMFIVGLFSVFGIYKLIQSISYNSTMAIIGAWAFNFSPSFYYYTINPLPDNFSLCSAIWGTAFFFKSIDTKKIKYTYASALLLSISALCKLPFIVYFSIPFAYYAFTYLKQKKVNYFLKNSFPYLFFLLFPLAWYLYVIPNWHGNGVVQGILLNNPGCETITNYLVHNLVSTLPELLLNYGSFPLFLFGIYFMFKNKVHHHNYFSVFLFLSCCVLFYFFFEINMIAKIHDYYLFPFMPLLFIIVSYGAYNLLKLNTKFTSIFVLFALCILPFTCYLRMKNRWNIESPGFNNDLLKYKNQLQNAVPNNALCIVGNDESSFIYFYYVNKKGWSFNNNTLSNNEIDKHIVNGAKYLYSDSRKIETQFTTLNHIDKFILEKGSIKVFKLK